MDDLITRAIPGPTLRGHTPDRSREPLARTESKTSQTHINETRAVRFVDEQPTAGTSALRSQPRESVSTEEPSSSIGASSAAPGAYDEVSPPHDTPSSRHANESEAFRSRVRSFLSFFPG